jgi:photosystem II stability/assembly factor-like uncharacterized protein
LFTVLMVPTADGLLRTSPEGRVHDHTLRGLPLLDVIVHPEDARVLYAASPVGGVLRTGDGGQSWTQVLSVPADALVMDADDLDMILAGTLGGSILATIDGGAHWEPALDLHSDRRAVDRLWNQPAAPEIVYAHLTSGELLRSGNRGRTWASCAAVLEPVSLVALHPRRVDALYGTNRSGLFRSEDGGRSWTPLAEPGASLTALTVLPGREDLIVVGTGLEVAEGTARHEARPPVRIRQAPGACALAADLDDPGAVYGVTREGDLLRTLDAGEHWECFRTRWPAPAGVVPFSHRVEG